MEIIALINHKGGTGKTTSVLNIGAGLAKIGKKVLLIDIDSQANLSQGLGVTNPEKTIYESVKNRDNLPIISIKENLDIVPSSLSLSGAEIELVTEIGREFILKELLDPIKEKYDYIIIDCPPNLGMLTLNALVVSHSVLIPLEAEFYAYKGVDNIVGIIQKVRKHYNPQLTIKGVFFTKCNNQRTVTDHIRKSVKESFGSGLLDTFIRINVALVEASIQGQDIFEYAPESIGSKDYKSLVNEIINRK